MTTYTFLNQGAAIPFNSGVQALFKRKIDIPDLVTNGGLATTANVAATLPSTGFAATDILEVFDVPAGTLILGAGIRVSTVEGATCTVDVGVTSATETHSLAADTDGWLNDIDLNALATSITTNDLGFGTATGLVFGQVYVTAGSIDILFNNASTETAIFDIWAWGFQAY